MYAIRSYYGVGDKTVSATIDGVAITQTATVTVNAGAVSGTVSTLAASPGTITVNSGTATVITSYSIHYTKLYDRSSGATDPPTITGGGMAQWDVVASATFDNVSNPRKRITIV